MNSPSSPRRALVVIDVQNEYFPGGKLELNAGCADRSLANILAAIDAAVLGGVPVILVRHEAPKGAPLFQSDAHGGQIHSEVLRRPHDLQVVKHAPSAFAATALAAWLHRHEIDTMAVIGYMTQNCVAATIFDAMHAGYSVEYLADASGALAYSNRVGHASDEEIHRVFGIVFESNFAAVVSCQEWIASVHAGSRFSKGSVLASAAAGRRDLVPAQ